MLVASQPRVQTRWSPVGRQHTEQDYYAVRKGCDDYANYWSLARDPDGHYRNRITEAERHSYLDTVRDELKFVQCLPPGHIVDFGCGPGWFLRELPEWSALGVEIAPLAIAELSRHDIPHVNSLQKVESCVADVVFCYHVIEHMTDPLDTLFDLRRILLPGGWFILGTPDFASPCAVRFGKNYRMLHDPTHCSLFTNESMHRCLRDNGWDIKRVRYPFPDKYAVPATWDRWHDTSAISPPWPGNWMTFYCQRSEG